MCVSVRDVCEYALRVVKVPHDRHLLHELLQLFALWRVTQCQSWRREDKHTHTQTHKHTYTQSLTKKLNARNKTYGLNRNDLQSDVRVSALVLHLGHAEQQMTLCYPDLWRTL